MPRRSALSARVALGLAAVLLTTCVPGAAVLQPELSVETVEGVAVGESAVTVLTPPAPAVAEELPPLEPPALPLGEEPAGPIDVFGDRDPSAPAAPGTAPPDPGRSQVLEPVQTQFAKIRLTGPVPPGSDPVPAALGVPGVTSATAVRVGEVAVAGNEGPRSVRIAEVDPEEFRVFTPQVTADATAVWERVLEGDAAFTHDAGRRLQVELGQRAPAANRTTLRIGAFASNGAPPVADAIVGPKTAAELGLEGEQSVLVAVAPGSDASAVAEALAQVTGLTAAVQPDPETHQAFLTGSAAQSAFEPFTYIDNGDGMIQIDPGWVQRNIIRAPVPLLRGEVTCHRLLVPQVQGAMGEIEAAGLGHLIDPSQYGGCWVPRHIDFNPAKPISMHGWGLAVDMNVSTNGLAQVPTMDPRIVAIFDKWGFVWGGRWRRPDGMHFELGALLQSPQG